MNDLPQIKNRQSGEMIVTGEAGMTMRATVERAVADKTDLSFTDLNGADLQGANLAGAKLASVSLVLANLAGVNLAGANLAGASLAGANLAGANLRGANLAWSDLTGADLQGADLQGADLTCVSFRNANLQGANLQGANLQGANLAVANLAGTIILDSGGKTLRATDAESISALDKVRDIILKDDGRLNMDRWHGGTDWEFRTLAEEVVCGTTHCLAGWLQVYSTNPDIRKMYPEFAGFLSAPIARGMFYRTSLEVRKWLESRAYVAELAAQETT